MRSCVLRAVRQFAVEIGEKAEQVCRRSITYHPQPTHSHPLNPLPSSTHPLTHPRNPLSNTPAFSPLLQVRSLLITGGGMGVGLTDGSMGVDAPSAHNHPHTSVGAMSHRGKGGGQGAPIIPSLMNGERITSQRVLLVERGGGVGGLNGGGYGGGGGGSSCAPLHDWEEPPEELCLSMAQLTAMWTVRLVSVLTLSPHALVVISLLYSPHSNSHSMLS